MKITRKLVIGIVAGLVLQGSMYLYWDRVMLAPASAFKVSASVESDAMTNGKAYYSNDRRYMAIVKTDAVEMYHMPEKKLVRTVELGDKQVSYFKWLEDRNLALMAIYYNTSDTSRVVLHQLNPLSQGHELSTTINNLPRGSKITDVAYSIATNVIYMQVQVAMSPALYRVYRTDANQELTRTYLNTSHIGHIGVLFDQDSLIFDNLEEGTVVVRHGDGSWQVISPPVGKYRLVNIDLKRNIYIAKLNKEGLVEAVLQGGIKGNFVQQRVIQPPIDIRQLQVNDTANKK